MKIIDANRSGMTVIGRQGENGRTIMRFPESAAVYEEYPEATVQVLHQRFGDPAAYPVHEDYIGIDDGVVYWQIQSGDTANVGRGQCELVFAEADVVVKTMIYGTQVLPSLSAGEEPPEPWESWTGEIARSRDAAAESAEAAAGSAMDAAGSAEEAENAKGGAEEAAEAAQAQAEEAGRQAEQAARSAEDAQAAAEDVGDSVAEARGYAETAGRAAQAAGDSAGRAAVSEQNAGQSAMAAAESETHASESADEAGRQADTASEAARAAAQSREAAGRSEVTAETAMRNATREATKAGDSALVAEGWAKGTQGGTPVESGSAYFENNARYYAELTARDAARAQTLVDGAVQTIDDAGAEQVQAVEDKGTEVLDSLPADYSALTGEVAEAAQDETGQEMLSALVSDTMLIEAVLLSIGSTFDKLPQDEEAMDIMYSIKLEADRLEAIYENWLAEREGA